MPKVGIGGIVPIQQKRVIRNGQIGKSFFKSDIDGVGPSIPVQILHIAQQNFWTQLVNGGHYTTAERSRLGCHGFDGCIARNGYLTAIGQGRTYQGIGSIEWIDCVKNRSPVRAGLQSDIQSVREERVGWRCHGSENLWDTLSNRCSVNWVGIVDDESAIYSAYEFCVETVGCQGIPIQRIRDISSQRWISDEVQLNRRGGTSPVQFA